ncbi:MAG TPA: hypothetical protein VLE95_05170 [Chlamydiales bacterium]|nr:hypothetical protein [Chlamydiales bacterium]
MEKEYSSIWQVMGPLTLLGAVCIATTLSLSLFPVDLFFNGAAGLYLCSRWQVKGCYYAVLLLAFSGIVVHTLFESHHLLRLGLEASFICSFIVIALVCELEWLKFSHLQSQLASSLSVVQNLEDESGKFRESATDAQIALEKKLEELQKNFDDLASEKSTIEILNDVLRKANAAGRQEKTALENQMFDIQREFSQALFDQEHIGEELVSLRKVNFEYVQLKEQFEEKNAILHTTRSLLFKAETQLQRIAIEKEQGADASFQDVHEEFKQFDEEIERLQLENTQLQELATHLIEKTGSIAIHRTPLPKAVSLEETLREALIPKRKKKTKAQGV